jgi:hypothetical protein
VIYTIIIYGIQFQIWHIPLDFPLVHWYDK